MKCLLIFSFLLFFLDLYYCLKINQCEGSMNAQIKKVTISTCLNQNSDICAIERNSSPEISIEFNYVSAVIARKANVTVNAFLDSAIIAPPVLYDACAHRVACPILQGSENVFKAPMPVKTQHVPPYEVAFSYKMRDGDGPMILCMNFLVTVAGRT